MYQRVVSGGFVAFPFFVGFFPPFEWQEVDVGT